LLSAEIDYKFLSDFRGGFFFVLSLMHSFQYAQLRNRRILFIAQ